MNITANATAEPLLSPPFPEHLAFYSKSGTPSNAQRPLCLPAIYQHSTDEKVTTTLRCIDLQNPTSIHDYLQHELDLSRLDKIFKHLWWAGLPRFARPLHQQVAIGRKIVVTEHVDCHLVWSRGFILVKPLPSFLLDHGIWSEHLCKHQLLYEQARGFLLTYLCLICHESDLKVAHDTGLLPDTIHWPWWTQWTAAVASHLPHDQLEHVHPRYMYAELRLDRLSQIYGLCSKTRSVAALVRGYHHGYADYTTFMQRNTTWFLLAVVYMTIVLTAMQVGLGTEQLHDNESFHRASYGFTVFTILAPLLVFGTMMLIVLVLFIHNMWYTLGKQKTR
ncbi:hypothetical protein LTR84_012817 [Exophiala bonariae]|uniref:Subtilisin-like serine protease n=1 Tax=Exophiala bonariae TaxID=1690606 RepID=A0AAV9MU94_9EURO|nr:hypothetical protein LTR84_012817 [Exophiala bonariae]